MLIHVFVVLCLALNPTQCVEQEIVPDNYSAVVSVIDCGRLGFLHSGSAVDRDGATWIVKAVHCRREGSLPATDIQKRLRAALQP